MMLSFKDPPLPMFLLVCGNTQIVKGREESVCDFGSCERHGGKHFKRCMEKRNYCSACVWPSMAEAVTICWARGGQAQLVIGSPP